VIDSFGLFDSAGQPSATNAFTILRTGGIALLNVNEEDLAPRSNSTPNIRCLNENAMHNVAATFISQLRSLLGLVDHQRLVSKGLVDSVIPSPSGIAAWEVDMLGRWAFYSYRKFVIESVTSLAALVDKIPNMPVPYHISNTLDEAIRLFHLVCNSQCACARTWCTNATDIGCAGDIGRSSCGFKQGQRCHQVLAARVASGTQGIF
jgi:hypothetical protein